MTNEDVDAGISELKAIMETHPKSILARLQLATVCAQKGEFDQSIEMLKVALEQCPFDVRAWESLGETYEKRGGLDEAISALEIGLKRHPRHLSVASRLSKLYLVKGEEEAAANVLKTVIKKWSAKKLSTDELASAYKAIDGNFVSIDIIRTAIEIFSPIPSIWQNAGPKLIGHIGEAFKAQKRFDDAIKALYSGLSEFPDDIELCICLSDAHVANGEHDEAIKVLENILEKQPTKLKLYSHLHQIYMANNDETMAVRTLEKKLENDLKDADALPIASLHEIQHKVGCDGCNYYNIRGYVYWCKPCKDYKLCRLCFNKPRHLHLDHDFLIIPSATWISEHCIEHAIE